MPRTARVPLASVALTLALACHDEPTRPPDDQVPDPAPAGLMRVTISGLTSSNPTASIRPVVAPGRPGNRSPAALPPSAAGRALATLPATAPYDGTIQLQQLSTSSFTWGSRSSGGVRYIRATFRVRNATASGIAYGSVRQNLTFIAVSDSGTIDGTAVSTFDRFDGTAVTAISARSVMPGGAAHFDISSGSLTARSADVFQAFLDAEVQPLDGGDATALAYGFVARHAGGGGRSLPGNPEPDQFDGLVSFALKVPLAPGGAADDAYTVAITVLPVDDSEGWVTQSLEETDLASKQNIVNRADSIGAGLRSLDSSAILGRPAHWIACLRTAGTAALPGAVLQGGFGC